MKTISPISAQVWLVSPLPVRPPFGYFVFADKAVCVSTRTKEGVVAGPPGTMSVVAPQQFERQISPVAVLVSSTTASSGEMTAIAFIGRSRTRLFAEPTAGFTSVNAPHRLSDGAILVLTEAGARDRKGKDYFGPVIPDELTASVAAETAAIAWLKRQCHLCHVRD